MKWVGVIVIVMLSIFARVPNAGAVCPVCTVAVAGGLGFSRWLGIDDTVTGVWIGGLILSSAFWLSAYIRKQNWRIPYPDLISIALFFLLVIPPLYWTGYMGLPSNVLWGVDKVLLGTMLGSAAFGIGMLLDLLLRNLNQGKVFMYFQKVIVPVFMLALCSYALFVVTQ